MCIATPPLARLRCHLLPTVSSRGPQIASRVKREREREMSPGRQLPRQMQPRHQIADGNQRICNVQLLLSRICNLCRAQIVTHNRGQQLCGFLGGALWPKCGLLYLSFSCSRQYAALVQNKIFTKILRKSIFFQNISRIPLSAVDIKIVHMVYRFLHKKYLLPYL